MSEYQRKREITIWIAGMLSTDGQVRSFSHNHKRYFIWSAERDWLEQIDPFVKEVGCVPSIRGPFNGMYYLEILQNKPFTSLLREHGLSWMIDRKWKRVVELRLPDPKIFKRLREDPVFFIEKLFGVKLFDYQKEICWSVAKGDNPILVLKGRQIGATFTCAVICLWFAATRRNMKVLILALYKDQAKQAYRQVLQFLYDNPEMIDQLIQMPYGICRSELKFINGSIIRYKNCSRPEANNIRSESAHLKTVDEAILILDGMWSAIEPLTHFTHGTDLYLSTAGVEGCLFHAKCARVELSKTEEVHFNPVAKKVISPNGVLFYLPSCNFNKEAKVLSEKFTNLLCPRQTPKRLQESLEDLKELNFRREHLCEWIGSENQMFPIVYKLKQGEIYETPNRYFGGLDVGETRHPTVLTLLKGDIDNCVVQKTWEWRRERDRKSLARSIVRKLKKKNRYFIDLLVMDNQGIGVGLYERLMDEGVPLKGVAWNVSTKNPMMFDLKDALTPGVLRIPEAEEQLIYELRSYFAEQIAGTTKYEFHTIDTDDYVDSLSLGWSAIPKYTLPPVIPMEARKR